MWTIAFVLAVTGSVHAQAADPPVPAPEHEVTPAGPEEPVVEVAVDVESTDATSADVPELTPDIAVAQVEETVEVEAPSVVQEAAAPVNEPIERIESTESPIEVDEDDLPPSLQREIAPRAVSAPREHVRLSPWRGYFGFASGLALHLNAQDEFQQGVVAPAYLHLRGGGVLPGHGKFRHALQLGVSTNLSREGAYPSGTLAMRQWVIVPSYVLRMGLDSSPLPAWIATARVGLPIVVSPDATVGAELALGAQYFARAGLAIFAELIYDVFVGGRQRDDSRSTHHLLTLEVGLQFELEVLP